MKREFWLNNVSILVEEFYAWLLIAFAQGGRALSSVEMDDDFLGTTISGDWQVFGG
jgi:hypothetical protein